jgi:hypothetical protein
VLHPSRQAPESEDSAALSRAAYEKAAHDAVRASEENFEASAREMGYLLGSRIYAIYLSGRVKPSGLRRLFLAHLDRPGMARKVCTAVIAKARAYSRAAR